MQRTQIAGSDGVVFSSLDWSDGWRDAASPQLVFLHATGFNAGTYAQLLQEMHRRHGLAVTAPDLRGHGHTGLPADPARLRSWLPFVDDALGLLERLERPLLLAGHSMGGTLALHCAARLPDRVQGVLALDPVLTSRTYWQSLIAAWMTRRAPMVVNTSRRRRHFDSLEDAFAQYRGRGAFAGWPDQVLNDYLSGGMRPAGEDVGSGVELCCDPDWEAAIYAAGSWTLSADAVKRVCCPVQVLRAERASTVRPSMRRLLRSLPAFSMTEVAGNHFFPMQNQGAALDGLQRLLDDIDSR